VYALTPFFKPKHLLEYQALIEPRRTYWLRPGQHLYRFGALGVFSLSERDSVNRKLASVTAALIIATAPIAARADITMPRFSPTSAFLGGCLTWTHSGTLIALQELINAARQATLVCACPSKAGDPGAAISDTTAAVQTMQTQLPATASSATASVARLSSLRRIFQSSYFAAITATMTKRIARMAEMNV
jgi:hypothetical protein